MLDSTGVNYGYNSFEEALSYKLLISSIKEKELKQSAENWKSAAIVTLFGSIALLALLSYWWM